MKDADSQSKTAFKESVVVVLTSDNESWEKTVGIDEMEWIWECFGVRRMKKEW